MTFSFQIEISLPANGYDVKSQIIYSFFSFDMKS
jgi:hypothetical protein